MAQYRDILLAWHTLGRADEEEAVCHVSQDNPFSVVRHGITGHVSQVNLFSVERHVWGTSPLAVGQTDLCCPTERYTLGLAFLF